MFSYTCRLNGFKPQTIYTIDGDTLKWQDDKGSSGVLPLQEIKAVYLKREPTRFAQKRYLIKIETNRSSLAISNLSYIGMADLRSDDQSYSEFVTELIQNVKKYSPSNVIHGGDTKFIYHIYQLISVALILLMVCGAWFFYTIDMPEVIGLKLFVLVFYLIKFKAYMDANSPRLLRNSAHIEEFLPMDYGEG
jgi:hypothetical protein